MKLGLLGWSAYAGHRRWPRAKCPAATMCPRTLRAQQEKREGNLVNHPRIKDEGHSGRRCFLVILVAGDRNQEEL